MDRCLALDATTKGYGKKKRKYPPQYQKVGQIKNQATGETMTVWYVTKEARPLPDCSLLQL